MFYYYVLYFFLFVESSTFSSVMLLSDEQKKREGKIKTIQRTPHILSKKRNNKLTRINQNEILKSRHKL